MAILKCKMCGGDLNIREGLTVAECEYCGSKQTVPTADNEKKLTLFARANRLRAACEFDKAAGVYESIVAEFPEEAEAYWGLLLCRFGIEYVDDPATGKKIPTCHRSSFDSVMDDSDFEQVMENADAIARRVYRDEAKAIEELRKRIIEVSSKEEPYDIFICYKETGENGERTIDSVIAQDVYDALTEKGYKVFFSRITLEDKLGVEYEPYIFAALNSAKIMLAFGTDYEYYNAVWVKNEWSRFLALIAKGEKKTLIPCYKGIDAYDMPKEFAKLQAQDMGKVGAMQDLLRGIEKILPRKKDEPAAQPQSAPQVVQQIVQGSGPNISALLKRGNMALEDRDWDKAKEYFDQVLNMDAENADAYLGMALAEAHFKTIKDINGFLTNKKEFETFAYSKNYKNFLKFASEEKSAPVKAEVEKKRASIRAEEAEREIERDKKLAIAEKKEKELKDKIAEIKIRSWLLDLDSLLIANSYSVYGLQSNGKVVSNYYSDQYKDWKHVIHISETGFGIVGTTLYAGTLGKVIQNKKYVPDPQLTEILSWKGIKEYYDAGFCTFGIQTDGHVKAACRESIEPEKRLIVDEVVQWTEIRQLVEITETSFSNGKTTRSEVVYGLCFNGEVCRTGSPDKLSNIKYVKRILSSGTQVAFLTIDGRLLRKSGSSVKDKVESRYGQRDGEEWNSITKASYFGIELLGLTAGGKVKATGEFKEESTGYFSFGSGVKAWQKEVDYWTEIVDVAGGSDFIIGLRSDGRVCFATSKRENALNAVKEWSKIVAIKVVDRYSDAFVLGIREDGTIVGAGSDKDIWEPCTHWKLFGSIETLKEEREKDKIEALNDAKAELRAAKERIPQAQSELFNLKGIFSGKRRKELENEIQTLEQRIPVLEEGISSAAVEKKS